MLATIENEFLKLSVKGSGAEMVSIRGITDQKEYLWQGDPKFWPRRAPVLFPIVGKLKDHKYRIGGNEYTLPQHGFARNLMFELAGGNQKSLSFLLRSNAESLAVFPFSFELIITYTLEGRRIDISYTVRNLDKSKMYFSIGGHPGFNVAVNPSESFTDYYLEFEKQETADRYLLTDGLFDGRKDPVLKNTKQLDLNYDLFKKDAIVLKNLESRALSLKSRKSDYHLKFTYDGFPYFGIWSPPGNAPFICLEPWYGLADKIDFEGEFKNKEGVLSLDPGSEFESKYSVELISCR
jgi:galactose mutarotase-like enzyme